MRVLLLFLVATSYQVGFGADENQASRYQSLETLARGLYYLETMYVDPTKVEQGAMVANALEGIVRELDPHTTLMPAKAFEQLTSDTQGKFGGVGIIVSSEKGKLLVVSPIEGTPADRQGIKPGDQIVGIDGVDVTEISHGESVEKMRGPPDSTIELEIKRKGESRNLTFKLTREVIKVKSVRAHDLGGEILYTRISSFQEDTGADLKAALEKRKGKIKGLVLDLRNNPGGLLDQAVFVSDIFIESGVIVSTVGRKKTDVEREFARKRGTFTGFPIVTLINGGSASASEIVAGALQDHERSLIIGTTSFGKGSVQTLVSLPDGSGLKLTVARYFTPKDRSIQAKGIVPDVMVPHHKDVQNASKKTKKEADLEGHIESKDLSDVANMDDKKFDSWPHGFQEDNQIMTAYTYLQGWTKFNKKM